VTFGFDIEGQPVPVHYVDHANTTLTKVYMSTPNLPVRYEIRNADTGGGTYNAGSLTQICAAVSREGAEEDPGYEAAVSRGASAATAADGTLTTLLAVRLTATHIRARLIPKALQILNTGGVPVRYVMSLKTTTTGSFADWAAVGAGLASEASLTVLPVTGTGLILEAGYIAGAKAVNPDIVVESQYLGAAGDNAAWGSPDKAKEIALAWYADGADIVYTAAGGSGRGTIEAAVEAGEGKWAIGVDSDEYFVDTPEQQAHRLTSMLKRVDTAVFEMAKNVQDGTAAGGFYPFDLSNDGVGYATSGGYLDDIVDQLEDFKAKIVSGEIVVPIPADEAPPSLPIFLYKPAFGIAAAWAYRRYAESAEYEGFPYAPQLGPWGTMVNDLERPVFEKFPVLGDMKAWLLAQSGVRAALLSGSGSTMLAVLEEGADAAELGRATRERYGESGWTWAGRTP
jgi:hypothetical protein